MKKFGSYQTDRNVFEFCEEPLFIQSEYFNVYFQKGVEDLGESLDLKSILTTSAHEVTVSQFNRLFEEEERFSIEERKKVVTDYFANCGFGLLDLKSIQAKGGPIDINSEYYGTTWLKHFGKRDEGLPGVGYFAMGFLCGVVEAIFGVQPGTFDGKQLKCISKGDEFSRFEIYRGLKRKINKSPALGKPRVISEENEKSSASVVNSLIEMANEPDVSDAGHLEWFDTTFTKHYVNYYALVEIKLLMQANKKLGPEGFKKVKKLLSEVSEKNAYFTFGKILNSDFWQKELASNEDFSGSSGVQNCLNLLTSMGCGNWKSEPTENSNQFKIVIQDCPRTNAFLKLVGNTKGPIGFVNGSTLVGIANLMQNGVDTASGIDNDFVNDLQKSNHFEYVEVTSRMVGGESDTLIVSQT